MDLTTRSLRNVSFAAMAAAAVFAQQEHLYAASCSSEYCASACASQGNGGYFAGDDCTLPCGSGCGRAITCHWQCNWCDDGQGWICYSA
jgi:hypothetical protein